MVKNVIFDFDGTIVDSAGDIIDCLESAYKLAGIKRSFVIERKIIGPALNKLLYLISPSITSREEAALINFFRDCYEKCGYQKTFIYEGVRGLLEELKKVRTLFIVTNKPERLTRQIIDKLNIDYFEEIVCIDTFRSEVNDRSKSGMLSYLIKKRSLSQRDTLFVGDSAEDMQAAYSNNLISVAVLGGYGTKEELRESKPDYFLEQTKDLLSIILAIEGSQMERLKH